MKIYTKTGDAGKTSLLSGERVFKGSLRVEAYGTIDELASVLGMARSLCQDTKVAKEIFEIQKLLVRIMTEVATRADVKTPIVDSDVQDIEKRIDEAVVQLKQLSSFLYPGDSPGSAALHVARTVARRAERIMWRLSCEAKVNERILSVLNRLSDYLFILARYEDETV